MRLSKQHRVFLLFLFLTFCAASLSACSGREASDPEAQMPTATMSPTPTAIPDYHYESTSNTMTELHGDRRYTFRGEETETEKAVYFFDSGISLSDRAECISITDAVLTACSTEEKVKICILGEKQYSTVYVADGTLYTCADNWQSQDYIAQVLLTVYGKYCNYGLCYGFANELCLEFGFDGITQDEMPILRTEEVSDMNILCFDERFTEAEDIASARALASYVAAEYVKRYGREAYLQLIADSGVVGNADQVSTALREVAGDGFRYSPILYSFGGETHDYIAYCEYAVFFVRSDYIEDGYALLGEEDWAALVKDTPSLTLHFLHEQYPVVKAYFETNRTQMGQYQELFALEEYNNDLEMIFTSSSAIRYSYIDIPAHRAYLKSVKSLIHEYIHSLMTHVKEELWAEEGFTRYFELRYDAYGSLIMEYFYNHLPEETEYQLQREYMDRLGREYREADESDLDDYLVYHRGNDNPNLNNAAGISFVSYLVQTYSEEKTIRYARTIEWEGLGKTFDELVSDWNDYILEKFE